MIEILMQIKKDGSMIPNTSEDRENLLAKYHVNQIVKVKVSGAEKERSITESNLFHACCKVVSDNFSGITDDPNSTRFNTSGKVKVQCKIHLKFFTGIVVTNENVQFLLKSLSFTKSKQAESHAFIKDAIEYMAGEVLGLDSPEKLVEMAKSRMHRK